MSSPRPDSPRTSRSSPGTEANSQWVSAWESLVDRQPHLRQPELAAHALRIPEAGLMALRVGQDSTRLRGRAVDWLSPVTRWGKVALTVRNTLGTATVRTEVRELKLSGDTLRLVGDHEDVLLSNKAAVHGFVHEDAAQTSARHGLYLYDPTGEVLLRLQLLTPAGERAALPHLLAHSDFESGTGWRASSIGSESVGGFPGWCSIESTLNRMEAARRAMVAAVSQSAELPAMRVIVEGKAVAMNYLGPMQGNLSAAPLVDGGADFVFSARTATANHAFVCLAPDGVPYLRFHDAETATFTLWPQVPATEARAWVTAATNPQR
ncbi:MAG: hypothetical protein RIQ60_4186 [Pseudomonadota bacterium]|jgi:hypothetical protein